MSKKIRIGTRSSELALWQANTVAQQLAHLGHETEIVKIDSIGDAVLDKPLYELGVTGVFTKNLDVALINKKIDIAVHSFKDVPTKLPQGMVQAAILKRGDYNDVLVLKKDAHFFENETALIATGSLRRKAQWLYRYPNHKITGLRGNVNTRLRKLEENDWNGAIFAAAGLKRLHLLPESEKYIKLDWMVPAPAQGAVMIAVMEEEEELISICSEINDEDTAKCVAVEREFLRVLEGGCTAPIGALARIWDDEIKFRGVLFSPDGSKKLEFTKAVPVDKSGDLGTFAANYILDRGGKKIMRAEQNVQKGTRIYSTKTLSLDQKSKISSKIDVEMSDFITIRSNRIANKVIKNPIENVLFTSKNAVNALLSSFDPSELQFKNIYCVGRRTKRLIERKIGPVVQSENSAEKMAAHLIANMDSKELTFFCGNIRREELPNALADHGFVINEVESYVTSLTPRKVEDEFHGILFFSPSAVASYLKENRASELPVFCIGETTAETARKYFKNIEVAKVPTVDSLINSVNQYFDHV
jgi:hydroxymethylbilane synthase